MTSFLNTIVAHNEDLRVIIKQANKNGLSSLRREGKGPCGHGEVQSDGVTL